VATAPSRLGKYGVLDKDTMREIIKKAHEACRVEIKFKRHDIGGKYGGKARVSLRRSREDYVKCLKEKIQKAVDEKLKELTGAK
jgi:hypothetical protein